MKTWSKILTDGAPIPLVDRNFGKSSRNGSGIFAWSWDKTALPPHFAPLPLLPRAHPHQRAHPRRPTKLLQPSDPHQRAGRRWPPNRGMAHLNGHDHPLPEGFPDPLFFPNRMGRCFAQPGVCSPWSNEDLNVLARCVCRMRHVWMIVVSARSVRSVKNSAPSKPGGSV
jgi:hypothetical protein